MKEFIIKAILALGVYLTPMYELFIVMFIFVTVDFVTGIIASNKKQVPRSSRRLRKSANKLVAYISAIMLAFMAEQAFQVEWFASHRYIGAFICIVELISILENFAVITEHPFFTKLIKLIRGKASNADKLIKEILDEKNDNHNHEHISAVSQLPNPKTGDDSQQNSGHGNNQGGT